MLHPRNQRKIYSPISKRMVPKSTFYRHRQQEGRTNVLSDVGADLDLESETTSGNTGGIFI